MLSLNWMTEKTLDFEYNKYRFLAYVQKVDDWFRQNKLFPNYKEVQAHYHNLLLLKEQKAGMAGEFPKRLVGIDWKNQQLQYKPLYKEGRWLKEVEKIADFALPRLARRKEEGSAIYEFAEDAIHIEPIGILPLYKKEGYILLPVSRKRNTNMLVFQYKVSNVEAKNEEETTVYTTHKYTWNSSMSYSIASVQSKLGNLNPELPVPATWLAEASLQFPIKETLLPVVKRILCKQILSSKG